MVISSFLLIVYFASSFREVKGLVCYCERQCSDPDQFNGTCEVSDNSYCFSTVELVFYEEEYYELRTYGCLGPDEIGLMQCRTYLTSMARPRNISCCREDNCNLHLQPTLNIPQAEQGENIEISFPVIIIVTCFSCIFLGLLTYFISWKICKVKFKLHLPCYGKGKKSDSDVKVPFDLTDQSSGSGFGMPKLVPTTIGRQIKLVDCIGRGRYGEVHLAHWRTECVAVKIFSTKDEASWKREKEIYEIVLLRHKNILGFKGADIRSQESFTQMLLVADYHPLGSLYDFLKRESLSYLSLLRMAVSGTLGLAHLHNDIQATPWKPSIAHRDLKSKNILVKNDGELCIADFGLAVKHTREGIDLGENPKVGTKRYMAPEVLNETLNKKWFESLKSADIYSFSLVLWEMMRRCSFENKTDGFVEAFEYKLPYEPLVPDDPSFQDMHEVVCVNEIRPDIDPRWKNDPVLETVSELMQMCWCMNPNARLSALRINKTLQTLQYELLDQNKSSRLNVQFV